MKTNASGLNLGLLLSSEFKRWNKAAEKSCLSLGLTLAELRVLMTLSSLGPSSMVTLSVEQGMTPPGMTLVVDKLEKAGLARRVRSDADRRSVNVAITGKGGEILRRAVKLQDKFVDRALQGLADQELDSFLTLLGRINTAAENALIDN